MAPPDSIHIVNKYVKQKGRQYGPYEYLYTSQRIGKQVKSIYVGYVGRNSQSRKIFLNAANRVSQEYAIRTSNLRKAVDLITQRKDFVVIDTETTGFSADNDRIIQLSAQQYSWQGTTVVPGKKYNTYIDPKRFIPQPVQDLTGIKPWTVQGAPTIDQVMPDFKKFIGNRPIIGQNIPFDIRFLNKAYSDMGYKIIPESQTIDTLRLSRILNPEAVSHSLEAIVEREGIKMQGRAHDSMTDVENTGQAFVIMATRARAILQSPMRAR
jgi:DNA polymerase III epsilon subunit family exonuclease